MLFSTLLFKRVVGSTYELSLLFGTLIIDDAHVSEIAEIIGEPYPHPVRQPVLGIIHLFYHSYRYSRGEDRGEAIGLYPVATRKMCMPWAIFYLGGTGILAIPA